MEPTEALHRPSNFHLLLKPLFPSILDSPFPCPQPQPPNPIATNQLRFPCRKAALLWGLAESISSHKGSVRPGHTGIQTEWNFSLFSLQLRKHTQTQEHIYYDISIPKFVLKKKEEIKLISLPTTRPHPAHHQHHQCPPPALFIPGRSQGEKQSKPKPHRELLLPGQCQACSESEGRNTTLKTYRELPSEGCSEGRRTGGLLSGHAFPEALGREGPASLAPSSQRRRHLTLLASGEIVLGCLGSHWA